MEAIQKPNVDVHFTPVEKIDETGVIGADGVHREVDTIVCATGFDVSYRPRFPIIGQNGVDLAEKWKVCPEGYLGLAIPNFPNFLTFIGPNWPVENGSVMGPLLKVSYYALDMIKKIQSEYIASIAPKQDVTDAFNEHCQEFLKRTVWVGGCRSWYKKGTVDGRVCAIYGGTTYHWMEAVKNPRWEDFKIDYRRSQGGGPRNRFAYLGNGFTKREAAGGTVGDVQTLTFEEFWDLFNLPDIFDSERGGSPNYKPPLKSLAGSAPAATS